MTIYTRKAAKLESTWLHSKRVIHWLNHQLHICPVNQMNTLPPLPEFLCFLYTYSLVLMLSNELWCWRRFLKSPLDSTRRSNQSILEENNPEYSLEGLMLKLKIQYSGHLMQRANSLEKTLMLGKIEGRRRREWQRIRWLDGITNSMDRSLS